LQSRRRAARGRPRRRDFAIRGGRRDELHETGAADRPRRVSERDPAERLGDAPVAQPAAWPEGTDRLNGEGGGPWVSASLSMFERKSAVRLTRRGVCTMARWRNGCRSLRSSAITTARSRCRNGSRKTKVSSDLRDKKIAPVHCTGAEW